MGSETSANPYTSSFISLSLVYPLPQPLISNRPRQCRKSAKGRHPVLKRYSGEGTFNMKKTSQTSNSVLRLPCDIIQLREVQYPTRISSILFLTSGRATVRRKTKRTNELANLGPVSKTSQRPRTEHNHKLHERLPTRPLPYELLG